MSKIIRHGQGNFWDSTIPDWVPGELAGLTLAANVDITSATLAAVTGLSLNVISGRSYKFTIELFVSDLPPTSVAATGGIQINLAGGTATVTNLRAFYFGTDNAPGVIIKHVSALATIASIDQLAGDAFITIKGGFKATLDGTFIPKIAQVTATGTLRLYSPACSINLQEVSAT